MSTNNLRKSTTTNSEQKDNKMMVDDNTYNDNVVMRMGIMFIATIFLVMGLFSIHSDSGKLSFFVLKVLPVLTVILGVFSGVILYVLIKQRKELNNQHDKIISTSLIASVVVPMFALTLVFKHYTITELVVTTIAASLVYYFYYFFDKKFFTYSFITFAGAFALFNMSFGTSGNVFGLLVRFGSLALGLFIAVCAIILVAKINSSKAVNVFGKQLVFTDKKFFSYLYLIPACIIIAGSALNLLVSGTVIYSIALLFIAFVINALVYVMKKI